MTTTDPTGPLANEWSYGFPNGDVEEGKPGPLPQRTPGSTLGADAVAESVVERAARRIESEGTR